MKVLHLIVPFLLVFLFAGCNQVNPEVSESQTTCDGKLFIIGGGKRPAYLVDRMIREAGVNDSGYVLVLPMASSEEDSAIYYSSKQFTDAGLHEVYAVNRTLIQDDADSVLNLIKGASLIYISGGSQEQFMQAIEGTTIKQALNEAYCQGALIAGTSAGAAVMSTKMITGNEFKHPEYTGRFPTIEANNIELKPGLGFMEDAIIDQHFVKRQRMNRLIAVSLENPENTCIGIDESTALLIKPDLAEVVGESQVIVIKHQSAETKIVNGLLGGTNLDLSIYLPGDTIDF